MPGAFIRSFKVVLVSWWTRTDPGILDWGVQTLVQKGLLNFFLANYFSQRWTHVSQSLNAGRQWRGKYWEKLNPFLPVRRARGSQSQPYYDDGMITLKVLLKSVYTSQNIISRWLCRDVFMPMSNITCFPRTLDFPWLTSSGLKRTTFRSIACRQVILQPFQEDLAFMRPWCFSFVYHTALTKIQGIVVLYWFLLTTKTSCTAEFKDLRHCLTV